MARTTVLLGSVGILLAGAATFAIRQPDKQALLRPDDPQVVALGSQVYEANCASCHGARLEGQPDWKMPGSNGRMPAPPHDETGHTWHHSDATLFGLTKHGVASVLGPDTDYQSDMPAYAEILTDAEIIAALSFIKSQWPQDVRERHDSLNEITKEN